MNCKMAIPILIYRMYSICDFLKPQLYKEQENINYQKTIFSHFDYT